MTENLLQPYMLLDPEKAPILPQQYVELCERMVEEATSIEEASSNYDKVCALLQEYPGSQVLLRTAADLLERKRRKSGMLDTWSALHEQFPEDGHILRMRLRWFRRHKLIEEGFVVINQSLPNRTRDVKQAVVALLAYSELQAFGEIDEMMHELLPLHPEDSKLRILYAKNLMRQNRFVEAHKVVKTIRNPERLSAAPTHIIAEIEEQASFQKNHGAEDVVGLLGRLISRYRNRVLPAKTPDTLGGVVFYTGQLGAGGAERQLTRIAAGLETIRLKDGEFDGVKLGAPIRVAVRHANAESAADFFLPVLQRAKVQTFLTSRAKLADIADLGLNDPEFERLLTFLPADILDNTRRLVSYFRKHNIQIAYLWQDGGILSSALAALIAGVPQIILSYRGLPPNLRPDLYRPQLEGLYRNLADVPGVAFSSNSMAAAQAYAQWLDIPIERFRILYNALVPAKTDGDTSDSERWADIQARSSGCDKTVVGVFRYDPNKRPEFWIKTAAAYLENRPDTRFIIVGQGTEFAKSKALVAKLGLKDRVFMVGRSGAVGYWLQKADVLLHLAEFEGLPNVVIEAQIAGLPVIATPAGGTSEALLPGETGYCLTSSADPDTSEVVALLQDILETPDKAARMGAAAQEFTRKRFTLDRALHETLHLFMSPPA